MFFGQLLFLQTGFTVVFCVLNTTTVKTPSLDRASILKYEPFSCMGSAQFDQLRPNPGFAYCPCPEKTKYIPDPRRNRRLLDCDSSNHQSIEGVKEGRKKCEEILQASQETATPNQKKQSGNCN
ncbi:uncharacterized protein B0T23DRAFT_174658 [Neurospora hispaniola]|uniref:Uncharacterized protein n=1 Tax=Neurospora hispaniola TaxID=588809 RepID=A0AAJ0MQL8_9PEZI|nr:hypothetical protein B0T23DRAFT_174658 [Neurospora hispaniola]